jgi:UDP-N-acetyl-2-amino-2-deoxyglucuronate dehydrogenase
MKLKIGIVGVGRVFEHYLYLSKKGLFPEVEFCGLFDKNETKLHEISLRESIPAFESLEKMLGSKQIDAVFILTPSGDHFEPALMAIKSKKPTLIEKPICLRVEEALRLEKVAEIEGVYVQSVLQNRFNPAVQELKSLIDPNRTISLVSGGLRLRWSRESSYYQDDWHGTWKMDGGVVSQQAIHHLFALDDLFGPMEKVFAKGFRRKHSLEAEDTAVGLFTSAQGVPFTFELTTAVPNSDVEASISVITSVGILKLGGQALNRLSIQEPGYSKSREIVYTEIPSGYGLGHVQEINNFVSAVSNGNVKSNLSDSIRALVLVHSIYASMEEDKTVDISIKAKSSKLGI